jgi:hypothetical protein
MEDRAARIADLERQIAELEAAQAAEAEAEAARQAAAEAPEPEPEPPPFPAMFGQYQPGPEEPQDTGHAAGGHLGLGIGVSN